MIELFENRSTCAKVIIKRQGAYFFETQCILTTPISVLHKFVYWNATPRKCGLPLALTLSRQCVSVSACLCVCVCLYLCVQIIRGFVRGGAGPEMTKSTAMILMMMMMMSIMTSSTHLLIYCPISAPNGTRLCAVGGQPSQTFHDEKLTACALATMSSQSVMFNFKDNSTHRECALYQSTPWSYEPVDNCVGYEVITRRSFCDTTEIKSSYL